MSNQMIDASKLEAAYIAFSTLFDMAVRAANPIYPRIATVIPQMDDKKMEFKMLTSSPMPQLWTGDRKVSRLGAGSHPLEAFDWANGLEIARDDIRRDKLALIPMRIAGLAKAHVKRVDAEVTDFYVKGFAATRGLGYDGQFMWDTDHNYFGGTTAQSNTVTTALGDTALHTAIEKFRLFVDDEGQPVEAIPKILMVGPKNEETGRKITKQKTKASGEENTDEGRFELLVNPRITGTEWFLIDPDQAVLPVVLGWWQQPQFVALDKPDSDNRFWRKDNVYGADAAHGCCYGPWHSGYASTGAG